MPAPLMPAPDAIRRGASPDEIRLLKEDYASHLQWMIKQRRKQDSIIQMATHEQMIVENSDKCGDDCFYLPYVVSNTI